MECFVKLSDCCCRVFGLPYGDQGLLISKALYKKVGGYKPLYLMEDIDIISDLSKISHIRSLGKEIYTSSRRWRGRNIIKLGLMNAWLRYRWKRGDSTLALLNSYYSYKNN